MMRQYIGARYTPKFSGVYDPTQQYENLEVVDNGTGTSYISKKPVPPNTPLTNTEYWALYGASSGAIIQIQQDISALQGDVGTLQTDVSNLDSSLTMLEQSVDDKVDDLEDADTHLYKLMQNPKEHNVIIVSDSYGDGADEFPDKLAEKAGWDSNHYHNLSVSGSSFYGNAGVGPHFIEQIQNYTGDKDAITDIIVAGGINDAYYDSNNTDLNTAMETFFNYAKTNYPNATIWLGFIGHILMNSPHINGRTYNKVQFTCRTYYYNAVQNGVNILKNVEYALSQIRSSLSSDGLHPSTTGATLIANAIYECLTTGSAKIVWPPYGAGSLFKYQMNDAFTRIFRDVSSEFYLEVPTLTNAWTEVANVTFDNLYFNAPVFWEAHCMINSSSIGTYIDRNVKFKFEGTKAYAKHVTTNSAHSGFETLTPASGVTNMKIYPHEMEIACLTNCLN